MQERLLRIAALMGTRLEVLRSLADEITAGQKACVALDLDGLQGHDNRKVRLCEELNRINAETVQLAGLASHEGLMSRLSTEAMGVAEFEILQRIRQLGEQTEAARVEVSRCNQIYAAFLRRAYAALRIRMNVMFHCAGIYPSIERLSFPKLSFEKGC
jgi:hypothetical protein